MAGGGDRRWWWRAVTVAGGGGGRRWRWPEAVVAGEEGRKGYIGNKKLVPLSSTYFDGTSVFHLVPVCSTYFDVKHGTDCFCSCLFHTVPVPNAP